MNLKTFAQEKNMSLDQAKELTGLNHWNKQVPEEFLGNVVITTDPPKTLGSKKEVDVKRLETDDLDLISLSINGAGTKSPYYHLKHKLEG